MPPSTLRARPGPRQVNKRQARRQIQLRRQRRGKTATVTEPTTDTVTDAGCRHGHSNMRAHCYHPPHLGGVVLIYIASFAGLLSAVVLAVVYLADRYEREPVELIQNTFLLGFVGQLVLVVATTAVIGQLLWSGPWLLITVAGAALVMPTYLRSLAEMDERFDGIVYTVACLAGATCVIHLNNLPQVAAASPFHDALEDGAIPGLRDLLIVDSSPAFAAELGQGLTVILAGVLIGATLGLLHLRGQRTGQTAAACAAVGLITIGLDVATGGIWPVRAGLVAVAIAAAVAIKRRSVFKDRPQQAERDVLILAFKTLLIVLGAALFAVVLLQTVAPPAQLPDDPEDDAELAVRAGSDGDAHGRGLQA